MRKLNLSQFITIAFLLNSILFHAMCNADTSPDGLSVISSANPQSNAIQSFIIIPEGVLLKEGIKHSVNQRTIGLQPPFVIEYNKPLESNHSLQWKVIISDKQHGSINLLSSFKGKGRLLSSGYQWQSDELDHSIRDRHRLIFRPRPFAHKPEIYKKGKGVGDKRRKYGGGTRYIDKKKYNPRFAYKVSLNILSGNKVIVTHNTELKMDKKDMIRQEYINHYNIKRYGRGKNGNIPIPTRDEINEIPAKPDTLEGNPLTESQYKLIINDGMLDLANKINQAYTQNLTETIASDSFSDLNNNKLAIPKSKLWVTSGWRNPERNEWYSNAVNGIHQRGGAVDLIIMAPSNSLESSIGYWILWEALNKNKNKIKAYWQLETNGRPMTSKEFKQDIEPMNGIPDAFDKADHLHANVHY